MERLERDPVPCARAFLSIFFLGLATVITGCEGTQIVDDLIYGTKSKPPDEFQVVNQPPLSMPPDYGLRPPKPGAERPGTTKPNERARQAVFGIENPNLYREDGTNVTSRTIGERALLGRSSSVQANPDIRRILNAEGTIVAEEDRSLTEQLLFMNEQKTPSDEILDPVEEYRRIYGQPVPSAPGTGTEEDEHTFGYE